MVARFTTWLMILGLAGVPGWAATLPAFSPASSEKPERSSEPAELEEEQPEDVPSPDHREDEGGGSLQGAGRLGSLDRPDRAPSISDLHKPIPRLPVRGFAGKLCQDVPFASHWPQEQSLSIRAKVGDLSRLASSLARHGPPLSFPLT